MDSSPRKTSVGQRYLTFAVDNEDYAIPILKVKEILGFREITPLPQTAASVRGVINLRGLIVPVVDLRIQFGLAPQEESRRTAILVLDLVWEGQTFLMGVVVDAVHEVQAIPEEQISPLFSGGTRVKADFVRGVADTPAGIRILIDVEGILSEKDMQTVNKELTA